MHFWKASYKLSSKIRSFRTLNLDKKINIRFHPQLVNQSFRQTFAVENSEDEMWSEPLPHRESFSVCLKYILSYGHLSTTLFWEKEETLWLFKARKSSQVRLITSHTLKKWKDKKRMSWRRDDRVWTLTRWQKHRADGDGFDVVRRRKKVPCRTRRGQDEPIRYVYAGFQKTEPQLPAPNYVTSTRVSQLHHPP